MKSKWIEEQEYVFLTKWRELQTKIYCNNQRIETDKNYDNRTIQ